MEMPHWFSGTTRIPARTSTICRSFESKKTTASIVLRPVLRRYAATSRFDIPVTNAPVSMSAWYGGLALAIMPRTLGTDHSLSVWVTNTVLGSVSIVSILLDHYQRPFVDFHQEDGVDGQPGTWKLQLSEDVTFLHKAGLRQALSRVKPGGHVVLDASRTLRMDVDVRDVIEDFKNRAIEEDISLDLLSPEDANETWILSSFYKKAS